MICRVPVVGAKDAIVDADMAELMLARKWMVAKRRSGLAYVASYSPTETMMHRLVLGDVPCGHVVDHIDGNTFNNLRSNLRVCTQRMNTMNQRGSKNNSSGFKGVSWKADISKWRARIMVNRREINLGSFDNPSDAARAYDEAAIVHFGDFAWLNFKEAA